RAGGVPAETRHACALLCLPRREQQRVPAGKALLRCPHLERRAVTPQLRDGFQAGQSGRSGFKPAHLASARHRRRRRRLSLGRAPVRLQARSCLAYAGGVDQRSDARFPEEVDAAPGALGITNVLMRFGTSPTGTTATTFFAFMSIAETERSAALLT